jgi:hypothetical protein
MPLTKVTRTSQLKCLSIQTGNQWLPFWTILDYIQPLKGGKHKHTPQPPSLSHTNNLPSPGRVTKCHTPMNSEFLFKDVVLIKVPWPHRQLYPGYLIHARILSGHTFSTLQSVPGSLIPEHIIRDLSLFVCPHRLCVFLQVTVLPVKIILAYPSSPYVSPPVILFVEDPYFDGFASAKCILAGPLWRRTMDGK